MIEHDRQGYEPVRLGNPPLDPSESEYVVAQIDLSSQSGSLYAWKEVQPNSTGALVWTAVPNGRSGTVAEEPAIIFVGFTPLTGVTAPVHVLLKTFFLDTGATAWVAVLPVSQE